MTLTVADLRRFLSTTHLDPDSAVLIADKNASGNTHQAEAVYRTLDGKMLIL